MSSTGRVLTVGETMVLLDALEDGPIREGMRWQLRVAGAESNFAIALHRLGIPVTWISRLGADAMGDVVAGALEREGLDLRFVIRDPSAPTGLFLKRRAEGRSAPTYYRQGSAAAGLSPSDVSEAALRGVTLLHLTGITMALGAGPRSLVVELVRKAKLLGATITFDPNFRSPLWSGPEAAASAQAEVLGFVDWYLCGAEEGQLLFRVSDNDALIAAILAAGSQGAVVRIGALGALVHTDQGITQVAPVRVEDVLDEIGAGDGFAAGFAYGLLRGWPAAACARTGNMIAAGALRGTGDWETYPYLTDIRDELESIADHYKVSE